MRALAFTVLCVSLAGCGDGSSSEDAAADDVVASEDNPACEGEGPLAVHFDTSDGVRLTADLYPAGTTGGPAVVLLHMNPESNDNSNFPAAFIEPLTQRTLTVLNVDRRGAGGSGGTARDAFEGPAGVRDAQAAQAFLVDHCGKNAAAMVWVGASNGTTTALDFTVAASTDPATPLPRGLVFLSGGTYTENQNAIADHLELLQSLPMLFAYPDGEAAWNDALAPSNTGNWELVEYEGGSHGTGLFTSNPESIARITDWIGVTLDVGMGW